MDLLTKENYLKWKERKMTDKEIMTAFNLSRKILDEWKAENGLKGYRSQSKLTIKAEKRKKQFLELYHAGWRHKAIADELGFSESRLSDFKKKYFPELKRKKPVKFTKEQIKVMEEHGLKRKCVLSRIHRGVPVEEAIRQPNQTQKIRFTKLQRKAIAASGLSAATVRWRIVEKGMTFKDAVKTPLTQGRRLELYGHGDIDQHHIG